MQHKINIFRYLIILNFVFVLIRTECLTDIGSKDRFLKDYSDEGSISVR